MPVIGKSGVHLMIKMPYLLFLGDAVDQLAVKVGQGIKDWRSEQSIGQLRLAECNADLGLPDLTLEQGLEKGAKTLVISVANRGGLLSYAWKEVLIDALNQGYDLASGLHNRLSDDSDLVTVANQNDRQLHDVRVPSVKFPIANGKKRSGKRVLGVGTDCSIGKMYTGLALHKEMNSRGMKSTFRSTGQTGILISGDGIPLDAIVADFMSGAVEWLTPSNDDDHWDIIEGQGSLFHVSYSGVTLALIHGGQPDALILCHEPTRQTMRGLPDYHLPSLKDLRSTALSLARIANPDCQVIGISVNTKHLEDNQYESYLNQIEMKLELPTVDPFRQGAERLVDVLQAMT